MFLKSNWSWLAEGWANMADLAERVDDLICSFDSSGETTMDTLSMLIFGWMLFGLLVLCVGKYVYNRFVLNELQSKSSATKEPAAHAAHAPTTHHLSSLIGESVVLAGVGAGAPGAAARLNTFGGNAGPKAGQGVYSGRPASSPQPVGPGGYVAPTPPVRKRLTRKTSGPLVSPSRSSRALHLPSATGADAEAVRWVNEMIVWLHSDVLVVDQLLNLWVASLNDFTANSIDEHGIGVEFIRVLPETHSPTLSNIFCECDSKDDVTITCDCEATPAFQLKAFRQKGDKVEMSHYRVNVNRFRARLNIVCITEKLLVDLKCDGWPEVKIALAAVGTIKKDLDETHLQEVVSDIVVGALRGINIHLNLSQYQSCPRLWREHMSHSGFANHMQYDQMGRTSSSAMHQYIPGDKRLLVKVVKAVDIGGQQGCREPYCIVELDEPPQRHQTAIKKENRNPIWDEAFLFDVGPNTTEVLLEIYDHENKSNRFLGLGIVGVEELLANPSQRQIIPLQARPYEEEDITGTLTVEFLFIEGAEVPQIGTKPYKLKETIKPISTSTPLRSYNPTHNPTILSGNTLNYNNDYLMTNGNTMDASYRSGQTNGNKGTLIVHSQQRRPERQVVKVTLTENGSWQEISPEHSNQDSSNPSGPESTPNSSNSEGLKERGRSGRKRRDFFGTIKRRLGRSKTRSRSAGPDGDENHDDAHSRSISADRARDPGSGLLMIPGREEHSRRSSLSETSAISGTSTRTYINEASTLVLETIENGIKKHYLVPLSLAQKNKWRKKGVKLHIFNDHTFIAKHMPGGTVCEVCKRHLARRLGKQGYECRDCLMKCHKHCHVKADSMCPTSTIQSIELTFVRNPTLQRKPSKRLC